MFRLILLPFVAFPIVAVGSDAVRQVDYQTGTLTPANTTPTFDNGYVVVFAPEHITASVYARDGSLAYDIASPEDGYIPNVAVDTDGRAAAAVRHTRSGSIAIFDRSGLQIRSIDTGAYLPSFVCFAPDHSIWTTGGQVAGSPAGGPEFFILRHFSRDGEALGAFLPRSSFEGDGEPSESVAGASGIRVANNRIGVWLNYGNPTKALWVEAGLNGKETGRWRVDPDGYPPVFTTGGALYAQNADLSVSVLDRAAGRWNRVPVQSDGVLIGADGDSLVFLAREAPRLRWIPVNRY